MKTIQIIKIDYKDINLKQRDASKLRGYFANKYKTIEEMHNHKKQGYIYKYPNIQYKVINTTPTIIGINEGANILQNNNIPMEETIKIGNDNYLTSKEIVVTYTKKQIGITNEFMEYEFISPWLGLNQNNISKYQGYSYDEQMALLTKILIGNILSLSKSLDYTVDQEIVVGLDLEETTVVFKNKKMIAFKGRFCTNFEMPDFIGLGKSCSRGFGTIRNI